MTPLKKDPQKEERILAAAMKVFAEKGLEKGTISEIAKYADIGKGTVYQYFDSKDDIFRALIYNFFDAMLHEWHSLIDADMDAVDCLRQIISSSFDILDDMQHSDMSDAFPVLLEIMLYGFRSQKKENDDLDLAGILQELYLVIEPLLQRGIKEGVFRETDAKQLAFLLFASIDGLGMHLILQKDRIDHNAMKNEAIDFFINAILKG